MTLSCPRCHTAFVVPRRRAQTTATAIGGVAAAIQGASSAMTEAKGGEPMGVIASAMLGCLLGGAAGCAVGAAIGAPIDHALPNSYRCQACGNVFDDDRTDPALT